ncbi:DUF4159 domain-containing protein [Prosthecomicrobium sp. N25]|uniref:DUF4159 domain-containing protein n=1 Tax=Prosthecomicrobium sp. N25 TaxID=3129254 RepID=UPI0030774E19
MSGFLPLAFTAPWVLGALVLVPAIWWLLRLTPPRPREVSFPPTRLLLEIIKREETPSRSPWWLTLLRLTLATLLILALAGPVWRPLARTDSGTGPLWIVLDNGWGSASRWDQIRPIADRLIGQAGDDGRPVALIATAEGATQPVEPTGAAEQRTRLAALEPRPWAPDRTALLPALRRSAEKAAPGSVVWLADGLDHGSGPGFAGDLKAIAREAAVTVYAGGAALPVALGAAENQLKALTATVLRADSEGERAGSVRALDPKGRIIAEVPYRVAAGQTGAQASFDLPIELRNDIARVEITGAGHAAAVQLLDERWRRRAVGILSGASADTAQPLLSPVHYLERALAPFAEVREPRATDTVQAIRDLVRQNVSVIMTADIGTIVGDAEKVLEEWVGNGGVLVRFAGPRLAAVRGGDRLVPVQLRQGGRTLGGALSWQQPQSLGSFSANGPFAGLDVPKDVTVTRQVLAEPHPDLQGKTWASLTDGTPLVTATRFGNGWLVLFHVTADTAWSNLPLSGSFIEMLRRVVGFSSSAAAHQDEGQPQGDAAGQGRAANAVLLPPLRLLDGFGRSAAPGPDAKPIAEGQRGVAVGREHPPGIYGTEEAFVAVNLMRPGDTIAPLDLSAAGSVRLESYAQEGPRDLKPGTFAAALVLLILDALAVLWLAGRLVLRRAAAVLVVATGTAVLLAAAGGPASANDPAREKFDKDAALGTRLAYVVTGNAEIDEVSRRGLEGLSRVLADRTALEPATPVGVDVSRDDLSFFPLLYWAIDPAAGAPSGQVVTRIDAFMKNGGSILFDTRDSLNSAVLRGTGRASPANESLRRILSGLDIPDLEPVPQDHVLTKAFYLLQDFPGRFDGGPLWVEATPAQDPAQAAERPVRPGDGVSPIMITGNDMAGAWALTESGDFLLPTVPSDPRQREMAFRVGINIVMYTLTGNYKADQVHVPALLERLGQ